MLRLVLVVVTLALASASLQAKWEVYKEKHGKTYSREEDVIRRYIYQANIKKIEEHNERYAKGEVSFYLGENQFADMTTEEVNSKMNGMRAHMKPSTVTYPEPAVKGLPDTVDWRKKGYVTPVKDQRFCGSCWAFSSTGAVEGQHFKATGKLVSLSESNLVDCSSITGNFGCDGGYPDNSFKYIIEYKGIDTEASYPYEPYTGHCRFNAANVGATISSYVDIKTGSETALQNATATVGPISAGIDATHPSFHAYTGGVYNEPACNKTLMSHAILVVGYGNYKGDDYWLIKNSWNTSWGIKGYMMMARNKDNQCGIATKASYPVV